MDDKTDATQNDGLQQQDTTEGQEQETEQTQPETEQNGQDAHEQESAESVETQLEEGEEETPQSVPYSRFNEIYYQKKQAEKQLEEMRAQQAAQNPPPIDETTKPRLDAFDYDEEKYNEALLDWKLEQRDKQAHQQRIQQEQQQQMGAFRQKQERYMANNPNYQQLANQADMAGVKFNDQLAEIILNSDTGVQIHHHLLSNPEKLERLNTSNPMAAMREIVRLEQNFSKKKPKAVSRAPDPITPSGGGARDSKPGNERLSKMSPSEYYQYRMAQKK